MAFPQHRFYEGELPHEKLAAIGVDPVSLSRADLEMFLSGNRTNVLNLTRETNAGPEIIPAKISLYRKNGGDVDLKIHPRRERILNDIGLSDKELKQLQNGNKPIVKTIAGERHLVQLDREINELLRVRTKSIHIPNRINDIDLSKADREILRRGGELKTGDGKILRLDLNEPSGFVHKTFEQLQREAFDYHNPQVIGILATDENRFEYTEYHKKYDPAPGIIGEREQTPKERSVLTTGEDEAMNLASSRQIKR